LESSERSEWFYRGSLPGISIAEQESAWRALGPRRHKYHFTRVCFCHPAILAGTVTVHNGVLVGVTTAFDGQIGRQSIRRPQLAGFKGIEQFFGVIREAQERDAARVVVKRDLRLRMPSEIIVDYLADAANDEVNYEAIAAESID